MEICWSLQQPRASSRLFGLSYALAICFQLSLSTQRFADIQNVELRLCLQVETHGASVSLPATLGNSLSFVRPVGLAAIPAAKLAISPLAAALYKKQTDGEPNPTIRIVFKRSIPQSEYTTPVLRCSCQVPAEPWSEAGCIRCSVSWRHSRAGRRHC